MKTNPLISVIVPAYNAEAFISETLQSVLAQTYQNLEVIVVDDGSRDCTPKIVEEFSRRDARVRLLQQSNRGVAAARNLAIANSRGEFIAPIDADDLWFPTKLERQLERLEKSPLAGAAYTWSVSINEKGLLMDTGPRWDLEGRVYEPLVLRNFIGNASVPLFRRAAIEKAGGYNEELKARNAQGCEDWEICLRVAEYFDYCVVQDYLVGYRCYNESMSFNHEAMGRSYALVMEDVVKRHPELSPQLRRWSKSIFYLYLTHKSNCGGDLRGSLRWLVNAIKEDPAVLFLPWANRCLLNRLARSAFYFFTKNPKAWQQLRPRYTPPVKELDLERLAEEKNKLRPLRFWDRIQVYRWAHITNYRSFSC